MKFNTDQYLKYNQYKLNNNLYKYLLGNNIFKDKWALND